MLVVLRLALGWHFLYEGVWKLTHHDAFLAETEGFLSAARGPAAKLFNSMVPDIDGQQRLERDFELVRVKSVRDAKGNAEKDGGDSVAVPKLAKRWNDITKDFLSYYQPREDKGGVKNNEHEALYKQFDAAADKVYQRHVDGLKKFVAENGDAIKAHFDSFARFNEQLKTDPSTDFMRQRRWDQLQDYRKEVKGWTTDLEAREKALKADLMDLLNEHRTTEVEAVALADAKEKEIAAGKKVVASNDSQSATSPAEPKPSDPPRDTPKAAKSKGKAKAKAAAKSSPGADSAAVVDFHPLAEGHDPAGPFRESKNPFKWPRIEQMAFLLSYGLTAIGFCLMIGLFTRLSALAGAAFMLCVVLSQPSYPSVYPPDVPQLGHALLVNKDFVEMIALLVIASTSLGRWTGMDFFLHNCIVRPLGNCCCCCCRSKGKGEKA